MHALERQRLAEGQQPGGHEQPDDGGDGDHHDPEYQAGERQFQQGLADQAAVLADAFGSIFKLSAEVLASAGITRILRPYIEQLAARCEESVFLALIDKEAKTVTYVDGIDSRQAIRYSVPIGTQRPLHVSAAGKVLFAFQDLAWQKKYLKTVKLKPMTSKPLPDRAAFEVQLQEIREAGVAVSIGEAVAGASGIAAPVVKADGTASYAFMIAAPSDRFVQSLPALRSLLLEVAGEASATLRHMPGG